MKTIIYLAIILSITIGVLGCKKEGSLIASQEPENIYSEYTLPQGNHDYDQDIKTLFNRYNTLFLYKYNPKDIYYNSDTYLAGTYYTKNDSTSSGMFDVASDEAWVGKQIDLLKELWLDYYPDNFLKKLPLKVFMVDSLYTAKSGYGSPSSLINNNILARKGVDYFLVTYGSKRISTMTQQEKYTYKKALHRTFLDNIDLPVPKDFAEVSNYTIFSNVNNKAYMNFYGFINWDQSKTPKDDWKVFMDAIIDQPYSVWISDGPLGFLHPSKDTQKRILKKYNIVIDHFKKEYQIDLLKISNDLSDY